jgi:hypothetical protein
VQKRRLCPLHLIIHDNLLSCKSRLKSPLIVLLFDVRGSACLYVAGPVFDIYTMRHLCKTCASLAVDKSAVQSFRESLCKGGSCATEILCQSLHGNISDLKASAESAFGGKGRHLRALVWRSLKDHRTVGANSEEAHLSCEPVSLGLGINAERA